MAASKATTIPLVRELLAQLEEMGCETLSPSYDKLLRQMIKSARVRAARSVNTTVRVQRV